jgi:hypothetical protein
MVCETCSTALSLDDVEVFDFQGYVVCKSCGFPNQVHTDRPYGWSSNVRAGAPRSVLKEGDVARFDNPDHIWHNEPVIVRQTKPLFFRVEVNGKLTWVPQDWIKES